jgi:ATP-dependent DNA ligase
MSPTSSGQAPRPQVPTPALAIIENVEWLVEPCWMGHRLLARFENGSVTLSDEDGAPAPAELNEVREVLASSVDADQAVLDGIWTAMPFVGEGSAARRWAETVAKETGSAEPDPVTLETRRAFIAWDLVELDGQPLNEIPFMERRRLLDSVIVTNVRVRVSPAVRFPLEGWLAAWRANGFTHVVAKHMNSRYTYGGTAADWLRIPIEPEPHPTSLSRLFGGRTRRVPPPAR